MDDTSIFVGLLGIAMFYSWIHSVVVIFKKLDAPTTYERVVLWVAFVTLVLFVLGSLS